LLHGKPAMNEKNEDNRSTGDGENKEALEIQVPGALLERMRLFCQKHNLDLNEFAIDAITEKLSLAYKERRKKPRL
jgi:hypothetical protein